MVSINDAKEQKNEIELAYKRLNISELKEKASSLQSKMNSNDFWQDNVKAQEVTKEHAFLDKRVRFWTNLLDRANELIELIELKDDSLSAGVDKQYKEVKESFQVAKRELMFDGPYDNSNVILSIFAGAGGTDAQDWSEMLLRMYGRWADSEKVSTETIDKSTGEEAGIKSSTIRLSNGNYLYGKLKGENGVHRLVRLSPFNSDNLRQTSFARVEIMPEVVSPEQVEIDDSDLKIDVYRSGGKGGQSVNTTDSAVRITHKPTGIVVSIQNERSQLQNKETALTILRSKLTQLKLEQHKDKISEIKGPNEQAAWGNQIRNYVMHPYTMVKDTRTKHQTTDVNSVLDGNINEFINSYLDSQL